MRGSLRWRARRTRGCSGARYKGARQARHSPKPRPIHGCGGGFGFGVAAGRVAGLENPSVACGIGGAMSAGSLEESLDLGDSRNGGSMSMSMSVDMGSGEAAEVGEAGAASEFGAATVGFSSASSFLQPPSMMVVVASRARQSQIRVDLCTRASVRVEFRGRASSVFSRLASTRRLDKPGWLQTIVTLL